MRKGSRIRWQSLLTVALLATSTKLKSGMTYTSEGSHRVDATMRTSGWTRAALIDVYGRRAAIEPKVHKTKWNLVCCKRFICFVTLQNKKCLHRPKHITFFKVMEVLSFPKFFLKKMYSSGKVADDSREQSFLFFIERQKYNLWIGKRCNNTNPLLSVKCICNGAKLLQIWVCFRSRTKGSCSKDVNIGQVLQHEFFGDATRGLQEM